MVASDNPAGRLVAILEHARKQSGNKKSRDVWGEVFGVEPKDTANLLYMYAQLIQLIRTAKDAVEQVDDVDHSIYLKPFSKLERVFAKANLEGGWQGTRNEIDDATVVALQFCADMLSRERGEGEIDEELLTELSEGVSELLEMVMASDLPDSLRIVLVENLEAVRRAILEYRLRGAEGLRRALETAIGSLIRHSEEMKKYKEKPSVKRYIEILGRLNEVVAVGLKTRELLAPVVKYFLSPGDG